MADGVVSYYADTPAEHDGEEYSKHTRSFLHDTNDDTIYLPATVGTMLSARKLGEVFFLENDDGVYLPIAWFIKNRPTVNYEGVESLLRSAINNAIKGD